MAGSKPRPRLTQKHQLLGRGLAAEDGVAVGVAAKALDDGVVAQLKAPGVFHARLIKQGHRLCVHQCGLAVNVGHVGKAALRQGQGAVLPTGHQLLRQRQGQRVLRKGAGGVAVHVARELVEHQDFGQAPLGRAKQTTHTAPGPPAWHLSGYGWLRPRRDLWRSATLTSVK